MNFISEKFQEEIFGRVLSLRENQECADCSAKHPTWSSIDFGVMICLTCAGIHRSMGTHLTRVKSSKLDKWTEEWIDIVSNIGNRIANAFYEFNKASGKPNMSSPDDFRRKYILDKYVRKQWVPKDFQDPVSELKKMRVEGNTEELPEREYNGKPKKEPQKPQETKQTAQPKNVMPPSNPKPKSPEAAQSKRSPAPAVDLLDDFSSVTLEQKPKKSATDTDLFDFAVPFHTEKNESVQMKIKKETGSVSSDPVAQTCGLYQPSNSMSMGMPGQGFGMDLNRMEKAAHDSRFDIFDMMNPQYQAMQIQRQYMAAQAAGYGNYGQPQFGMGAYGQTHVPMHFHHQRNSSMPHQHLVGGGSSPDLETRSSFGRANEIKM